MADFTATYVAPVIRPSGSTFAQFQAGGLKGILENLIAANVAIAAPVAAPTGVAGGSGGTLPAGAYLAVFTYTDGWGETTASPESSAVTITSGQKITWTLPALPTGASGINLYMTAAAGASGSETLYDTGIVGTSYVTSKAKWAGKAVPPTNNITGLEGTRTASRLRSVSLSNSSDFVWGHFATTASNFVHGDPISFDEVRVDMLRGAAVMAMFAQVLSEAAALVAANPGSLPNGVGTSPLRTWP